MTPYIRLALLAAAATAAQPAFAAKLLTDYSVQTLGSFTSAGGGSRFDRGIAAGGNAYVNSEKIGNGLSNADKGRAVVAVKGDVTYQYSRLNHGDVVHGGKDLNPAGHKGKDAPTNGTVRQGEAFDFSAYEKQAIGWSGDLAGRADDGGFSQQWGAATLTAKNAGLNIFNLSGDQFAKMNIYSLKFLGDKNAKFVINIDAAKFDRNLQFDTGGYAADSILFNFYNAEAITLGGWKFDGSILAPKADVTFNGNTIGGSVVAWNFKAGGTRVDGKAFNAMPDVSYGPGDTGAIPEPGMWAMMLVGFLFVGAILRRRRPVLSYVTD